MHSPQNNFNAASEKLDVERETLAEWTLRRFEEMTRIAQPQASHEPVLPPILTGPLGESSVSEIAQISPEPTLEQKLYETYVKLRDLMEQYGLSKPEQADDQK